MIDVSPHESQHENVIVFRFPRLQHLLSQWRSDGTTRSAIHNYRLRSTHLLAEKTPKITGGME